MPPPEVSFLRTMASVLAVALLPVLILLCFLLRKDRNRPEPPLQLLKAFGLGVLCAIPALALVELFTYLGLSPEGIASVWDALSFAFWGAAIPEELAKFFVLWLVLRNNEHFDEKMDGIVYAVCVSLGFAAIENVICLAGNAENFVQVGLSRGLFSIPGHFCDGVLMGYYYSLYRFMPTLRVRNGVLILAAPILTHGVYDSILFAADVSELLAAFLSLVFYVFCYQLWKYASRRIAEHLAADGVVAR